MPYAIENRDGKFVVVNRQTRDVKGTHDTRAGAEKQMRLLYGIEHGMKPRKGK